ncbi:MAG: TRAP transporter small permease [Phycisphaerales bacterium]|jgi:TRAP-type C4-dicarboxylate transport system permease small subunit|nr:TRAP transporter small permease [Phycisphaerales bacterium]MBT7171635.1 TRAP transporter small permease [Phycisphaerales bacterium]
MLKWLKRIRKSVSLPLEWLVILAMAVMTLDILWGVMARYFLPSGVDAEVGICLWLDAHVGYAWTDELATSLLVWVGLLGSCVAYERKSHLGVDVLTSRIAPLNRKLCQLIVHALVATFAIVVLLYGGWKVFCGSLYPPPGASAELIEMFEPKIMTALRYPSGADMPEAIAIYLAVPIAGLAFTLLAIENFLETLLAPPAASADIDTEEVTCG